jgi:hypothetical protein
VKAMRNACRLRSSSPSMATGPWRQHARAPNAASEEVAQIPGRAAWQITAAQIRRCRQGGADNAAQIRRVSTASPEPLYLGPLHLKPLL